MSFNPTPDWTSNINISLVKDAAVCPLCKTLPGNYSTVIDCILACSYYKPRHIPPSLTFVCDNPECSKCDEEFTLKLKVIVYVE